MEVPQGKHTNSMTNIKAPNSRSINRHVVINVYQEVSSYCNVSIVKLVASQEFRLLQGLPHRFQC